MVWLALSWRELFTSEKIWLAEPNSYFYDKMIPRLTLLLYVVVECSASILFLCLYFYLFHPFSVQIYTLTHKHTRTHTDDISHHSKLNQPNHKHVNALLFKFKIEIFYCRNIHINLFMYHYDAVRCTNPRPKLVLPPKQNLCIYSYLYLDYVAAKCGKTRISA